MSSSRLMRRQQGEDDSPTRSADLAATDRAASCWIRSRILASTASSTSGKVFSEQAGSGWDVARPASVRTLRLVVQASLGRRMAARRPPSGLRSRSTSPPWLRATSPGDGQAQPPRLARSGYAPGPGARRAGTPPRSPPARCRGRRRPHRISSPAGPWSAATSTRRAWAAAFITRLARARFIARGRSVAASSGGAITATLGRLCAPPASLTLGHHAAHVHPARPAPRPRRERRPGSRPPCVASRPRRGGWRPGARRGGARASSSFSRVRGVRRSWLTEASRVVRWSMWRWMRAFMSRKAWRRRRAPRSRAPWGLKRTSTPRPERLRRRRQPLDGADLVADEQDGHARQQQGGAAQQPDEGVAARGEYPVSGRDDAQHPALDRHADVDIGGVAGGIDPEGLDQGVVHRLLQGVVIGREEAWGGASAAGWREAGALWTGPCSRSARPAMRSSAVAVGSAS